MFNEIRAREMGVSKFFSIGNQVDITHADLLEALEQDDDTRVVGLFIEAVKDGEKFLKAASRIARHRPVVAFKGGRTQAGVRAAASHTGSMAGTYHVYRTALEDVGVIVVEDSQEFFDTLMALSSQKPPRGNRVAIMTISGGPSVVAGDVCESSGIEVPPFPRKFQKRILELTPPFAAPSNPVDMTPQMNPANYAACVDLVLERKDVDGVIAINVGLDQVEFADAFINATRRYDKPITSFTIDTPNLSNRFKEAGVPIYPTPERAVNAYRALVGFSRRSLTDKFLKNKRPKPPSKTLGSFLEQTPDEILPEAVAKKALSEYGVPTTDEQVVRIWSSTLRAAQDLGYPLALKVHSPKITHKSDAGAVILNIEDENALRNAWERLTRDFPNDDLLLQRMVPPGWEILIGAKRDPVFGPVAAVGLGGIFVEVFQDLALGTCPLEKKQVKRMLASLRAYPLLKGYRGKPGVNEDALTAVLLSVSDFMLANPDVTELDINPVIASGDRLTAVDALVRVKRREQRG